MDARQWHIREEHLLTVHTLLCVKSWKVTVVGVECNVPFNTITRRSTPEIVLSRKKHLILQAR